MNEFYTTVPVVGSSPGEQPPRDLLWSGMNPAASPSGGVSHRCRGSPAPSAVMLRQYEQGPTGCVDGNRTSAGSWQPQRSPEPATVASWCVLAPDGRVAVRRCRGRLRR